MILLMGKYSGVVCYVQSSNDTKGNATIPVLHWPNGYAIHVSTTKALKQLNVFIWKVVSKHVELSHLSWVYKTGGEKIIKSSWSVVKDQRGGEVSGLHKIKSAFQVSVCQGNEWMSVGRVYVNMSRALVYFFTHCEYLPPSLTGTDGFRDKTIQYSKEVSDCCLSLNVYIFKKSSHDHIFLK